MITGPVAARLGERRALMLGMIADGTGYILLAFATRGWMAFPIMVLLASWHRMRCKQCCRRWMRNVRALRSGGAHQPDLDRRTPLHGDLGSITTWNGGHGLQALPYLLCLPALRRGLGGAGHSRSLIGKR